MELAPFDFNLTPESIRFKAHRIEWLPFWLYYSGDITSAAFDFGKKMLYLGSFGFLVAARRSERGKNLSRSPVLTEVTLKALGLGVLLESAQILTLSRTPSTTDVLTSVLGAGVGGVAYLLYRELTKPEASHRRI